MGIDNIKFAKPSRAKWMAVRRSETAFVVYRPDGTVYDTFGSLQQAAATASVRQRADDARARKTERPCMCCRKPFESEGIHNRLCDTCRRQGDGPVPCSVAASSRGARKVAR